MTRGAAARLLAALLATACPPATVAAADGAAVFSARCASCHAVRAGAPPGAGPNLAGVHGRRVAGDPDFGSSPVLEAAGRENRAWDAAALERFLADPEDAYPGTWMGSNGLRSAEDRAAVVDYLRSPG